MHINRTQPLCNQCSAYDFMYGLLTVTDLSSSYLPVRKSSSPSSSSLHYTSKAPALISVSQSLDCALQSHISLFGFGLILISAGMVGLFSQRKRKNKYQPNGTSEALTAICETWRDKNRKKQWDSNNARVLSVTVGSFHVLSFPDFSLSIFCQHLPVSCVLWSVRYFFSHSMLHLFCLYCQT